MSFRDRVAAARDFVWVIGLVSLVVSSVGGLVLLGAWAKWGDDATAFAREALGIVALAEKIDVLTGERRIIRMPEGQSYVVEPVYKGDRVTLVLVVHRTARGATCELVDGQSLFEDDRGVAIPGSQLTPRAQVGTTVTRRRIVLDPPSELEPGRIMLAIQLKYRCGTETFYELTDPVFYWLKERP